MAAFNNFNPGELNRKIEIILPGASMQDEDGFETTGEETRIIRCSAKVTEETGTKALASGTEFSVIRYRFLIRDPKKAVTTDMMVRYKGQLYQIVRPPGTFDSGRFMEIWTEAKEQV